MRERELKQDASTGAALEQQSLPMRERELKLDECFRRKEQGESLPMRERELKLLFWPPDARVGGRSPCGSVN